MITNISEVYFMMKADSMNCADILYASKLTFVSSISQKTGMPEMKNVSDK